MAELIRPRAAAVTTPPAARTAATMMNRSMLCEIPERFAIFIVELVVDSF